MKWTPDFRMRLINEIINDVIHRLSQPLPDLRVIWEEVRWVYGLVNLTDEALDEEREKLQMWIDKLEE